VLDADSLQDLIGYREYRNKGVVMAAKSLLNFYREHNPSLLPAKDRLVSATDSKMISMQFGEDKLHQEVPGAELLNKTIDEIK
jgi:protein SDA1